MGFMEGMAENNFIDNEDIRQRIQFMMDKMGLNAASFADNADITRSVISNVLNQKSNVTIDTINKILSAYPSWNKNWLLFGEGMPECNEMNLNSTTELLQPPRVFDSEDKLSKISSQSLSSIDKQEIIDIVKASYFAIKENEKIPIREIEEIKLFYSDGSYETFHKTK